jgi:hypothetical protein
VNRTMADDTYAGDDFHRDKNLKIFPTNSSPYNISFSEWTGRWWKWAMSIPAGRNPLTDDTGKYCSEGQNGPVWFLGGTSGKTYYAKRNCIIPSGKSILFPIIVSQFSYSEVPFIKTDEELISHTAKDIVRWSVLEASVDGVKLPNLNEYRIQYGPFDMDIPNDNIWNTTPGPTKAASDGFWIFLETLEDGKHTISFRGKEPNFQTEVTYNLTIKP